MPHINIVDPVKLLRIFSTPAIRPSNKVPHLNSAIMSHHRDNNQCIASPDTDPTPTPTTNPSITTTPSATPTITIQPTQLPTPTATIAPTATPTSTPTPAMVPTATPTPSSEAQQLLLTEIMPAPTSPNPEWIELYNPTASAIDLTGWHIDDIDNGGSALQALTGTVPAYGYFLFELKSAILNNSGDDVRLLDSTDTVVSETSYTTSSSSESWGLDMETLLFCAQVPTPGVTNTTSCTPATPTGTPSPTITPLTPSPYPSTITPSPTMTPASTPTPTPGAPSTATQVFISEFLPRPTTGSSEWVELYNDSDNTVSLDGWYIDDIAGGGSSPKQITTTIAAKSYASIQLTSAILNNDTDSVRLLDPQQQSVDELSYVDAEVDISFSRHDFSAKTVCKTIPTPAEENNSCIDVLADATTQDGAPAPSPTPIDTGAGNTLTPTTPTQLSTNTSTPTTGDIQGISTYRPISDQGATQQPITPVLPQTHTRSRMAFALASMTSSGAALLLFVKKIKPW